MKDAKITPENQIPQSSAKNIELVTTDDLIFEIGRLNIELMGSKKVVTIVGDQIKKLQIRASRVDPLEASVKAYTEKQQAHIDLIQRLRSENEVLTKEIARSKAEKGTIQGELDALRATNKRLAEEVQKLRSQLEASIADNGVLKTQIDSLSERLKKKGTRSK